MIDFKNSKIFKLSPVDNKTFAASVSPMLVPDEHIYKSFQTIRDGVVFTNKRIITINHQKLTGIKVDYTSLPYSKIQAYSVETAGHWDLDSELELWFSGLGNVKLEFLANTDILDICGMISMYVL